MRKKCTVYLANLANTMFGPSPATVPLEIGYIKAYAVSQCPNEVDIKLFRTFETLYEAIQNREPDIVGCAWYAWNQSLTTNALTYIKDRYPNIMTVVGGANVPEEVGRCLNDFKEFPCIDVMIPNEGEIPFVNLLKVLIQGGRELVFKTVIDGVFYCSDTREQVIAGKSVPSMENINILPSPYLGGHLDDFLESGWLPMVQTSRGCPYHCTYCVSGRDSWNRVRRFDMGRVVEEINYLEAKAKDRTLRFTDDNLGMVPRDLEILRYVADKRGITGYPIALRMYTDKHINERIKEIASLLRDLIPMNISIQTLSDEVLRNVGRVNISRDELREAASWGHLNSINITTELIFGLPGETYTSFMNVINQLVDLRFDSVAFGTLMMLKETEINTPESINKYGYRVLYSAGERGYTKVNGFENVEVDAWAVENRFYDFNDFIKINLFNMIYAFFMFFGYFKEAVYIWDSRGLKITDIIAELLDHPVGYPFFSQQIGKLKKCLQDNLFKSKDELRRAFIQRSSERDAYGGFMNHYILSFVLMGEMIHPSNRETMLDEAFRASIAVFDKCGNGSRDEFMEEVQFAKSLVQNIIIPFWETPREATSLSSQYDLRAWRNNNYIGTLPEYKLSGPLEYQFHVRSMDPYHKFVLENSGKPFALQSELFYREFRSNNVRRFLHSDKNRAK